MSVDVIIVGAGLAGCTLAWNLHWRDMTVMLLDRNDTNTASRVAAGLVTPITGKRLVKTENYEALWSAAEEFYYRVAEHSGRELLQQMPVVRLFVSESEKQRFLNHRLTEYSDLVRLISDAAGNPTGFAMCPGGRLQVQDFLQTTRDYFSGIRQYQTVDLKIDTELKLTDEQVEIPSLGLSSQFAVLCQGFQHQRSQWFPDIPDSPARGDILSIRIPGYHEQRIVHRGIWLVPEYGDTFLVGATYDWQNLSGEPSEAGRNELLERLRGLTDQSVQVLEHRSAVRPGMKNYRPVANLHPNQRRLAVFNGLGTKGVLWAPSVASQLAAQLYRQLVIGAQQTTEVRPNSAGRRMSLTRYVHQLLSMVISPGDTVIDATAGNGYDTLFLARQAGPTGRITAFDIQSAAIASTRLRLQQHQIDHAELWQCSHTRLNEAAAPHSVTAITFNLGYLPGADRKVVTSAQETVTALNHALNLLRAGGVLTVVCYRGHPGGLEETKAVEARFRDLPTEYFSLQRLEADDQNSASPVLLVVRRLRI